MIKLLTLALTCYGFVGVNMAIAAEDDPRWYFGLDYARLATDRTSVSDTDVDAGLIKFGYDFNNWLSLEAHGGASSTDDSNAGLTAKLDFIGFFGARFNLRLEKFVPYVIVGGSYVREKLCISGACTSDDDASAAGGIGFDIYGTKDTSINFTAMLYNKQSDSEVYLYSLGFKWYFDLVEYSPRY